ncbi:MAG: energy-coupling factor transporter transmembrane component T family protein [Bryobacteraceae bacterium]
MHHVVLEQWSRGETFLHRRDARAKLLSTLGLLIAVATSRDNLEWVGGVVTMLLAAGAVAARLPLASVLRRACVVLPFCLTFGVVSVLAGDPARAVSLVVKGYVSSLTVILLVGVTPLPDLLRGMEQLGVPRFLLMVAQFIYRYLFVISEQAQHMRLSSQSRGGLRSRGGGFRAAAGALAVLFARSYDRAERVHRSMIARGFDGRLRLLVARPIGALDLLFLAAVLSSALAIRLLSA